MGMIIIRFATIFEVLCAIFELTLVYTVADVAGGGEGGRGLVSAHPQEWFREVAYHNIFSE